MPRFDVNRARQQVGGTLRPRSRRSGSGQVHGLWQGVYPPNAPTSVSLTAVTSTTAVISFTAPTDNGNSDITNYQYSLNNGSTWIVLSPADAISPITITGLTPGTAYTVRIRAVNDAGEGEQSGSIAVSTSNPPTTITFLAVGGGGAGQGGWWGNDLYGTGGGGGGSAFGTVSSPTSGTVTVGAGGSTSSCFGQSGFNGGVGNSVPPAQFSPGVGGGRTTTGGGNGGNGGGNTGGPTVQNGPTNDISGTNTHYGGGGGNASYHPVNTGGLGGGGNGGFVNGGGQPTAGGTNTGGGGGGSPIGGGASGGSGIVIIRYPNTFDNLTSISGGLVWSFSNSGGFKRYTFTGGTGTVTV